MSISSCMGRLPISRTNTRDTKIRSMQSSRFWQLFTIAVYKATRAHLALPIYLPGQSHTTPAQETWLMWGISPSNSLTAAMVPCRNLSRNRPYFSKRLRQTVRLTLARLCRLHLRIARIQVVKLVACPKLFRMVVMANPEMWKSSTAPMSPRRCHKHKLLAYQIAVLRMT